MTTFEEFAIDIDSRVAHINTQVDMGASREEVVGEQYNALLNAFSQANGIELDVTTKVSQHLQGTGMWNRHQLAAFSACLRANTITRLHQPGNRAMQSSPCLEYYFLQADWDRRLMPKLPLPTLQETVGLRMHSFGIACPGAPL